MDRLRFRVPASQQGVRLDRFLDAQLEWTRAAVRGQLAAGAVRVNGEVSRKGRALCADDEVEVWGAPTADMAAVADASVALSVVYEDAEVIVLDKPAGVPTHPLRPGERGCVANGLLARFPEVAGVGREARQPGLVNRLDNHTSGLLLAARNPAAFEGLAQALREGRIEKRYLAVCDRVPDAVDLRYGLAPHPVDRKRVAFQGEPGSEGLPFAPAHTQVCSHQAFGGAHLLELSAHRARRHQVRCHLRAAGCAIVGDTLYGGRALPGGQQMLHASYVSFVNPLSGKRIEVESDLPEGWAVRLARTETTGRPGP